MCVAGALDPRFTRVWALHGSGGSYVPLEANMKRTIQFAPARAAAAAIANVIINGPHLDPVRWVPRIALGHSSWSTRAMTALAAVGGGRLDESARDPEQVWMSRTPRTRRQGDHQRLVAIVLERMRADESAQPER